MIRIYHELPGGYSHILVDLMREGCEGWDVELVTQDNDSGQLSLTIGEDNPEFDGICTMRSEIVVMRDDQELWRGRATKQQLQKHWQKKLVCKGVLDYLYDGVLMPQVLEGSAESVLQTMIDQFNARNIAINKLFSPGTVSGIGQIVYEIKKPTKAFKVFSDLIKEFGGSLFARRDGDGNVIDWLGEDRLCRSVCSQKAVYGQNVSKLDISLAGDESATVLYGFGKNDLTFAEINGGNAFVCNEEAIEQFGWIEDCVTFSDVTDAQTLMERTQAELDKRLQQVRSIEAKILDLSFIDPTAEPFTAGHFAHLRSSVHDIDEIMPVKKITCPLFAPSKTQVILGASLASASTILRRNL